MLAVRKGKLEGSLYRPEACDPGMFPGPWLRNVFPPGFLTTLADALYASYDTIRATFVTSGGRVGERANFTCISVDGLWRQTSSRNESD